MKRTFPIIVAIVLLLSSCQESSSTVLPTETNLPRLATYPKKNISETATLPPTKIPETATPPPTNTSKPPSPTYLIETLSPTSTSTPAPITDAAGNITWHPQQVLIFSEKFGGDGVGYDFPPGFVLLWDGTLLQPGKNTEGAPYISHLEQGEVCKLLNTIDGTGFFEEPNFYNFPFDGLGSQYVTVNGWKSNSSGTQALEYALSGAPYYDGLFCRDCPIPSEETIIKPGLANTFFLLKNFYSPSRMIAPVEKLQVYIIPAEEEPTHPWPVVSISTAELFQKCDEVYCYDTGMLVDGETAKEIWEKVDNTQIFSDDSTKWVSTFRLSYRPVWPYEPPKWYSNSEISIWENVPKDYTITCNPAMGRYSTLPLDPKSNFWYYSPDGKWGAEVVDNPEQPNQIRIVNTSGNEKFFEYSPDEFEQSSIKVVPRYWTENIKYFFVNILPGDFDFIKTPFVNSLGLQRISITDGKADYIFQGKEGQAFAYSISDENEKIAYIRQGDNPLKITIKDVFTSKELTAPLISPEGITASYSNAGTIAWSPDDKSLFVAANYEENGKTNGVIFKIDASNPNVQTIVYQDDTAFKLVQSSFHDHDAGICSLETDFETYCQVRVNLETGNVYP